MVFYTFYSKKSMDIDWNRLGYILSPKSTQPPLCPEQPRALKLHSSSDVTQNRTWLPNCSTHSVLPWALWIKFSHGTFVSTGHHREPTGNRANAVLGQMERVTHLSLQRLTLLNTKTMRDISDFSYIHWSIQFCSNVTSIIFLGHSQGCIAWSQTNLIPHKDIYLFSPSPVLPVPLIS